jgi:hypothetical protein
MKTSSDVFTVFLIFTRARQGPDVPVPGEFGVL